MPTDIEKTRFIQRTNSVGNIFISEILCLKIYGATILSRGYFTV